MKLVRTEYNACLECALEGWLWESHQGTREIHMTRSLRAHHDLWLAALTSTYQFATLRRLISVGAILLRKLQFCSR